MVPDSFQGTRKSIVLDYKILNFDPTTPSASQPPSPPPRISIMCKSLYIRNRCYTLIIDNYRPRSNIPTRNMHSSTCFVTSIVMWFHSNFKELMIECTQCSPWQSVKIRTNLPRCWTRMGALSSLICLLGSDYVVQEISDAIFSCLHLMWDQAARWLISDWPVRLYSLPTILNIHKI